MYSEKGNATYEALENESWSVAEPSVPSFYDGRSPAPKREDDVEYLRILRPNLIKREDNEPLMGAGLALADAVSSIVMDLHQQELPRLFAHCDDVLRVSREIGMQKSVQLIDALKTALTQSELDDATEIALRLETLVETYIFTAVDIETLRKAEIAKAL